MGVVLVGGRGGGGCLRTKRAVSLTCSGYWPCSWNAAVSAHCLSGAVAACWCLEWEISAAKQENNNQV